MLTREQAIMIINEYIKYDEVTIQYSFPYHLIPKEIKEDFYYSSSIVISEENFLDGIKSIVLKNVPQATILNQTIHKIEFLDEIIDYTFLVNELKELQKQFDNIEENDLMNKSSIELWDNIRNIENLLIEKAEQILKIKEEIDSEIILFSKAISDKNKW